MSELVLYRKYRPKSFEEVVGQEHVISAITNAIKMGRTAHAYLFSGPRGVGKTTVARLIAKALNCANLSKISEGNFDDKLNIRRSLGEGGLPIPCNSCGFCESFNSGRALDLIEIDAASNRGVDEVRELREGVRFVPTQGKYKTYIIDECLTEDHLITLADGRVKPIAELKNGDSVASVDINTGFILSKKISNWFSRVTKELVYIRTPQGMLKCTPAHRLWVVRRGKFELIEAQEVQLSDFIPSPLSIPHSANNVFTPDQLALLALIQCDGHISKDTNVIQLEVSKDVEYFVETFKKGIRAWGYEGSLSITKTARETTLIRYYSRSLKERFMELGCPSGKKGALINIPDVVFKAPLESIVSYIDTCFCCEGDAVSNDSKNMYKLNFSSTSVIFAKKLQFLLKKFGIAASISKIQRKKIEHHVIYRLGISGYDLRLFQKNIGLTLKRKAESLEGQLVQKEKQDSIPIQLPVMASRRELGLTHSLLNAHHIYLDRTQGLMRDTVREFISVSNSTRFNVFLQFRYEKVLSIEIKEEVATVYDFTVDDTHTFIANGLYSSNCHQLTKDAFSALLKTLEEPPAHAVFVLATTELDKVPATIVSRTQHFDFRRPNIGQITNRLTQIAKKEGVKLVDDGAHLIALAAEGSMRDGESILGQIMAVEDKEITRREVENILGLPRRESAKKMFELVAKKDASGALALVQELHDTGYDLTYFSKLLMHYFRNALFLKTDPELKKFVVEEMLPDELECLTANLSLFSSVDLSRGVNTIFQNMQTFKKSPIPQLPLEITIIELIQTH